MTCQNNGRTDNSSFAYGHRRQKPDVKALAPKKKEAAGMRVDDVDVCETPTTHDRVWLTVALSDAFFSVVCAFSACMVAPASVLGLSDRSLFV